MRYDAEGAFLRPEHPDYLRMMVCNCGQVKRQRTYTLDGELGFVPELRSVTWRDVSAITAQLPAQARIRRFIDLPSGWVYLFGRPGNGKTTLASLAVNLIRANAGLEAVFANVPELLNRLRRGVRDGDDGTMGYLRAVPVLALDDLGAERTTEWANEQLYELLNYRYVRHAPTIITSNLRPEQLGDERLASRLADVAYSTVIDCGSGDIRMVQR
jgi:DNA replication protein DnaC